MILVIMQIECINSYGCLSEVGTPASKLCSVIKRDSLHWLNSISEIDFYLNYFRLCILNPFERIIYMKVNII